MAEMSRNAETTKIHSASLAMLATLMDSSEALTPKKKAGIVKTRQKLETAKIHAIVRFQPKVAAILNRGHPGKCLAALAIIINIQCLYPLTPIQAMGIQAGLLF